VKRILPWLLLWLLTLGVLDIKIRWGDGTSLHLVGWPKRLAELYRDGELGDLGGSIEGGDGSS
jgi:hypothetical protein